MTKLNEAKVNMHNNADKSYPTTHIPSRTPYTGIIIKESSDIQVRVGVRVRVNDRVVGHEDLVLEVALIVSL